MVLLAAAAGAADELPFEPSADRFADANACKAGLLKMVAAERQRGHAAVEGPYDLAPGDVRTHWVDVSGSGHVITEHRCLAEQLSRRIWRHSMEEREAGEIETIEDMAAKAEWLKQAPAQQQ